MINKVNIFIMIFLFASVNIVAFADTKSDIYTKLECCKCAKAFTSCECEHAKEIKAYISALLEVGLNEEEVLIKVAKRYSLDVIIDNEAKKAIKERLIAEAGQNRPEIFIEPLFYSLGQVSKSRGELELVVKVKNKGNDTLVIDNLKTSCPCTTVRLQADGNTSPAFAMKDAKPDWKAWILPAEEAQLIIVTDLNHSHVKVGKMLRVITVKSNDPIRPLTEIRFEVEIVE